jgi:hypothetical protein
VVRSGAALKPFGANKEQASAAEGREASSIEQAGQP